MAATSITRSFDSLLTTTLQKFSKKLRDQIFVGVPLFDWLNKGGRKQTVDGGTHILEHLMYEQNSTARSFFGYDAMDLLPQEGLTVCQFTPREYDVNIVISRREKQQNSGAAQMISLLETRVMQARKSLVDLMNEHAFAAQTGNNLDGLQTLVSDAATTVGSVSESAEAWWAPQRDTTALTAVTFKDALLNITNDCSRVGMGFPDLYLTTQAVWEIMHGLIEDQGEFRLANDNPAAGFGRKAISYRGTPFVWDADCPAAHLYLLNSETIRLQVYSGADFDVSEMKQPIDQHAWAKSIYFMGNMTINERRANGVMTNIT